MPTKETTKETTEARQSHSIPTQSLEYRLLIEKMVIRKFGLTVKSDQLAKFLGFENGVIPTCRVTSLRNNENSLDIAHDGSVSAVQLLKWLIHKNRLSVVYADKLFGDEKNRDLLLRFPKTHKEGKKSKFPYYYDPNKQCSAGHISVHRTVNRQCFACTIAALSEKSRSQATKRLFGVTQKEAEPVIQAFDRLSDASKTVLLSRFVEHIEIAPELITKLAVTYLDDPDIRQELNLDLLPGVDGLFSAINAWGKTRARKEKTARFGEGA
ncbi:MAG: hypothetical protein WJ306_05765 [Ferrovum myxofaciens]